MKRQHIIDRLVAANYTSQKLLNGLTNEHLNNLYNEVWPRLLMRKERIQRRDLRREAELRARRQFEQWQREWLKNWVHPKIKYPFARPDRPVATALTFGLKELKETATWMVQNGSDPDARATLRVIEGKTLKTYEEEKYESGRRKVIGQRRNTRRRFRHASEIGIRSTSQARFA